MVLISSKNDRILSFIEELPDGTKISVRGLASSLSVSDGTVYKAIKEAERRGLVATKPKSGTIRTASAQISEDVSLTLAQLSSSLGLTCFSGRQFLQRPIRRILVCDGDIAGINRQLEQAVPGQCLCIIGNRPDIVDDLLNKHVNLLFSDQARPSDYQMFIAEQLGLCILGASQNTYILTRLLNSFFFDWSRYSTSDLPVSQWMRTPHFLFWNDIVKDWHRFYQDELPLLRAFPVVNDDLELCGSLDVIQSFSAPDSQKLYSLLSDDVACVTVDKSISASEAANKLLLSGSPVAAVTSGNTVEGYLLASDLLRCFMFSSPTSRRDPEAFLSFLPDLSTEDRLCYDVLFDDTDLSLFSAYSSFLINFAAEKHLSRAGVHGSTLSGSSIIFPASPSQEELSRIQLSTTLSDSGHLVYSVDVELFTDVKVFARAMLTFIRNA